MTHDTGRPKDRLEEREHGAFVPPDEQHVREDGTPTAPAAESAEGAEYRSGMSDADRVEALGTEADPRSPENRYTGTDTGTSRDADPTLVDPEPATPLDTGTAEDAERADDMARTDDLGGTDRRDNMDRTDDLGGTDRRDSADDVDRRGRTDGDLAAEDEARAAAEIDGPTEEVDSRRFDADGVHTGNVDGVDVDNANVDNTNIDSRNVDNTNVDMDRVDMGRVDPDEVAVGTAAVPQQATAPTAEFWPTGQIDDLRSRWDAVQMRFVDDPSGVADDAKALVGEAVSAIREAIDRIEAKLDEAVSGAGDETEQLRQRVAHYRDVFETLLKR